ncbi:MAG: phospho-N-acetylmuramoyl-pentapeptide-transferase [Clostridia bacterium]|nr:phospho-N-acetylmuramoyl-pentapeptide-transferase [Clostridia bacterium]
MQTIFLPVIAAFVTALILGPLIIPMLQKLKFGQTIRDDGPQSHLSKQGTPTMGGLLIILSVLATCAIFLREYDLKILMGFAAFIGFGLIGFIDDAIIIKKKQSLGLRAWQKLTLQILLATAIGVYIYLSAGSKILLPFSSAEWDIGIWIIPLSAFILVAMSNSVNLTDGLDGLATSVSLVYFAFYAVAFAAGLIFAEKNIVILVSSLIGGGLGFLFFNRYPARIFMGDTGSLALGGIAAYLALVTRTVFWIPIVGLMFVLSSISVIIQVYHYKRTKKRVFKMAPLHHHFEQLGYHEITIVATYIIISLILAMVGLMAFR